MIVISLPNRYGYKKDRYVEIQNNGLAYISEENIKTPLTNSKKQLTKDDLGRLKIVLTLIDGLTDTEL
jgi:hypothetical protein